MDKITSSIKCVNCLKTLSSPVVLPCGHCICKTHADESTGRAACNKCGRQHSNCSFYVIEALADLIESKIDTLQFGQSHKEAKSSCDKLNDLIARIDVLLKDPSCYVYDMFSEFRRRVDLKSEQLKFKIDQEAQTILDELNKLESECKEKLKSMDNSTSLKLEKLINAKDAAQHQLEAYSNSLNELNLDVEKWKSITNDCHKRIDVLEQKLGDFNDTLSTKVFDLGTYNIENFTEADIDPNFELWKSKLDSKILINNEMMRQFVKLCEFTRNTKFELLYRGSRDGFKGNDFHEKCDKKPKTVTIIKTTKNYVFGGYTAAEWDLEFYDKIRDYQAFLFSLVNHENAPIKIKITNGSEDEAIYNHEICGPGFGDSNDGFYISDECNVNEDSCADLRVHYKHPKYDRGSKEATNFLAGSSNFQVAEIEVFQTLSN